MFDEANWSLTVGGGRVAIESKPLEVLRELLLHPDQVVTKDELLDRIWPQVTVVEASLPTAVRKLRLAIGDDRHEHSIIETVSGIGYRLAVPVDLENRADAPTVPASVAPSVRQSRLQNPVFLYATAGLAIATAALALALAPTPQTSTTLKAMNPQSFSKEDLYTALRKVDVDAIETMLAAGLDPNKPIDTDQNVALNILLNNCEWDPGHDQRKMLLAARTLVDADADLGYRNAWGDTAYSIASAPRYCGPDHPVTKMILTMCNASNPPIGDRCFADYKRDASGKVVRQD